ncbi:phytoene/squalene synthase family protein [Legionella waltersii]|uniref:All-trans-phytoene synthase n=1 Tax=Legionella waltersii TaxID=66969 RepID=A0A0W0ZZW8_9GAMM|nr:phytoene/squalene synthase family protein [Legionella waltersii]KTD74628.1 All-trans-phytoene synthase [Legionella waltersii]SNV08885.1 Dehydrosqualene synthase [Legionella waltersii]
MNLTKKEIKHSIELSLEESYKYCSEITKKNSSFYFGLCFVQKDFKKALFAVYAWMRYVDDIADTADKPIAERISELDQVEKKTDSIWQSSPCLEDCIEPFWPALIDTINRFKLNKNCFDDMIFCQRQDLQKQIYHTEEELLDYCKLAAGSSVGRIFVNIFGLFGDETDQLAVICGISLQLTNILRDPIDDLNLDRVYIPTDLLGTNLKKPGDLINIPIDNQIKAKQKLIDLTKLYYQRAFPLAKFLDRGRLTFLILMNYYWCVFNKICKEPQLIIDRNKTKLNWNNKLVVLGRSLIQWVNTGLKK